MTYTENTPVSNISLEELHVSYNRPYVIALLNKKGERFAYLGRAQGKEILQPAYIKILAEHTPKEAPEFSEVLQQAKYKLGLMKNEKFMMDIEGELDQDHFLLKNLPCFDSEEIAQRNLDNIYLSKNFLVKRKEKALNKVVNKLYPVSVTANNDTNTIFLRELHTVSGKPRIIALANDKGKNFAFLGHAEGKEILQPAYIKILAEHTPRKAPEFSEVLQQAKYKLGLMKNEKFIIDIEGNLEDNHFLLSQLQHFESKERAEKKLDNIYLSKDLFIKREESPLDKIIVTKHSDEIASVEVESVDPLIPQWVSTKAKVLTKKQADAFQTYLEQKYPTERNHVSVMEQITRSNLNLKKVKTQRTLNASYVNSDGYISDIIERAQKYTVAKKQSQINRIKFGRNCI